MTIRAFRHILTAAAILVFSTAYAQEGSTWKEEFGISNCRLLTKGQNPYFILEPGHELILEADDTKVQITVLDETKTVDGILTRIVEEKEWKDRDLYEIARNYFALCEQTKDVFYFGEDVDFYKEGKVVNHDGAWLAGTGGNRAGLIMPGTPRVGMKYYQEIAPGVAMDRAEIVSLDETCTTPAGMFSSCMKVKEGTALDVTVEEYKYYAPGIGLVQDDDLALTKRPVVGDSNKPR